MRLFREPLVHFALLGGLIFIGWGVSRKGRDQSPQTVPAISRNVEVTSRELDAARVEFRAVWKREPDARELGEVVERLVQEEILFREALAQGLDRDDKVVRRRLIEKMTAIAQPSGPAREPTRDELRRWYETYAHRFRRPAATTFDALFFDPKRRPDPSGDAARALATLAGAAPTDATPAGVGDTFILSERTRDQTEMELSHLLGASFARAVSAAPEGRWQGPLSSTYGVHLVRVARRTPERLPPFEEVEKQVRADWLTVETRGERAAAAALAPRYQVVLPPELRRALDGAPALAPYLARAPR